MLAGIHSSSLAQTSTTSGETSITLDVGFGIRAVAPSRVTVPAGERLRIIAPAAGEGFTYIWTKNNRAIAGQTNRVFEISAVTAADAGTYGCLLGSPTSLPAPSQAVILGVGPTERLLNLSTRLTLSAGADQSAIAGFVVAAGSQPKKIIVRAVGPSLALFGVANPLRSPVLRIFDRDGRPYENAYAYPAVVGGPTYESDLADSLTRAGAFALPPGTRDVVLMMPFNAGSYTAQVTSADASAGSVLLEIYEVP